MSLRTDPEYLRSHQYRDSGNLNTRISIHRRFSVNPYPWQRWIFDHLEAPAAANVLELGAGTGDLWLDNADRIPTDWLITITDLSSGMLDKARQRLAGITQVADAAVADAQALPFSDASFDLVVANMMLYHVADRPTALREIRRVLRPGSLLCAATFGDSHLRELMAFGPPEDLGAGREFALDNGRAQLEPFFESIELVEYEDALEVTDPRAVIDYLLSTRRADGLDPGGRTLLEAKVMAHFAEHGALHVTKSAGLFLART